MPPALKSARDLVALSGLVSPAAEPGALVPAGSSGSQGKQASVKPETIARIDKDKVSGKDILSPACAYLIYLIYESYVSNCYMQI